MRFFQLSFIHFIKQYQPTLKSTAPRRTALAGGRRYAGHTPRHTATGRSHKSRARTSAGLSYEARGHRRIAQAPRPASHVLQGHAKQTWTSPALRPAHAHLQRTSQIDRRGPPVAGRSVLRADLHSRGFRRRDVVGRLKPPVQSFNPRLAHRRKCGRVGGPWGATNPLALPPTPPYPAMQRAPSGKTEFLRGWQVWPNTSARSVVWSLLRAHPPAAL